ncbi:MAG: TlpA family protein disulfide reductase [Gammaproteobacteria bacterium]|nr:TlpA family protein disulfide reductase [Gammaproteobacteria bacterium]
MIRKLSIIAALLLVPMLVLAAPADDSRDGGGRAASGTAAGVGFKDFEGKDRRAGEFIGQGKWTVVAVWSADCPICKAEIFHMTFLYDEHKNKDIAVLGLSIDGYAGRKKAKQFVDDQGLNFPNLIGEPDDASLLSGTMFIGTPTYYFFTPEGGFAGQRIGSITQDISEQIVAQLKAERAKKKKG